MADDLRYAWVVEWPEGKGPPADLFESWPDVVPVVLPPDPTTGAPRVDEGQQLFEWLDRPLPAQPPHCHGIATRPRLGRQYAARFAFE